MMETPCSFCQDRIAAFCTEGHTKYGYRRGDAVEFLALCRNEDGSWDEQWVPAVYNCSFDDEDEPVLLHIVSEAKDGTIRHISSRNLRKAQKFSS